MEHKNPLSKYLQPNLNFSALLYLLDQNPGCTVYPQYIILLDRDLMKKATDDYKDTTLDDFAEKLKFKRLYNVIFISEDSKTTLAIQENGTLYVNSIIPDYGKLLEENEFIKPLLYKSENVKNKPKIGLVYKDSDGDFSVLYSNLKDELKINHELHYNTSMDINTINEIISSKKSGLILFSGIPGTGKTTLIKYLSQLNKETRFVYLDNSTISMLSSPSFTTFCLDNLKDSIIIIEDAELALRSRDSAKGYDISTILNLTDGIMGDILNTKIIATLNVTDKIDSALLRKGRLLANVEFNKLTVEQANGLAKELDKDAVFDSDVTVSEVYNTEDNGVKVAESSKIGFTA